nr:uncharacterized protein LOC109428802 [Aedes albopictus]
MKKTSTQPIKKPTVAKRLPPSAPKPEDNPDTKKKQTDLTPKSTSQNITKKTTSQTTQLTATRIERKPKTEAGKQRVVANPKASLAQLKKQLQATSSTRNVPQPKKPTPGNFNVTVNSPPSSRKPTSEEPKAPTPRDRTKTRTLKPEEVTVLKPIPRIPSDVSKEPPKAPVSFDIQFQNDKPSSSSSANQRIAHHVAEPEPDDDDKYESEFESYESDFESGSSKKSSCTAASAKSSSSSRSSSSSVSESSSSSDEEHGKSQANNEQKLDSGNYEMKMKRLLTVNEKGNSLMAEPKQDDNQPDSGMNSGLFENHSAPTSTKLLQKRYADILEKLSFNTMAFELYEDQPAPYELFLKNYGKTKDVQNYTQTETDTHSSDAQTERIHQKSAWVQYPPQFSLFCLNNMTANPDKYSEEKLGVGQENFYVEGSRTERNDEFSDFLTNLELNRQKHIRKNQSTNKSNFKLDELRSFLHRSLYAVEAVLIRNTENCDKSMNQRVDLKLEPTLANSTVTSANYDSKSRHILLTFHECDVEKSYHRYVISVWDTRNCIRPTAILSCWSIVVCTERIGPIILGGTTDGTLCLWDIANNNEEQAAPLQLIAGSQLNDNNENCHYGSIVAIRSSDQSAGGNSIASYQVITLYEAGILITWSISKVIHSADYDNNCDLNTVFHPGKFQLIQQNLMNLRTMMQRPMSTMNTRKSRVDNFQKGSLEDLLSSKNDTTDEFRGNELWSTTDMQIWRNKAILLLDQHILVINYLEQKCLLVLRNLDHALSLKEHPLMNGFMFTISSDNSVRILKIHKNINNLSPLNTLTEHNARQQYSQSTTKHSPVLNNKSCAIQNIVKNERKLYHEASSHADGLLRPLSSHSSENQRIAQQRFDQRSPDQVHMYHNQLFFLRQLDQRNPWMRFLSQGHILCVGTERNARFIDLKTGQQSCLSDYIDTTHDAGNRRLLGTTDKQMIMTTDGQGIFLHDISSSFKSP